MALERELQTYRRELQTLLSKGEEARYVLIFQDKVDSIWATLDEALAAGYERFGLEPFLAKKVAAHEEPVYFSRRVMPCQ